MDIDEEIITEFIIESNEGLERVDFDLVELERTPGSVEIITSIFRTMHTIKGSSAFLAFTSLERITHAAESLLSHLRDGRLEVDPEVISALLAATDAVRRHLQAIQESGAECDDQFPELEARLLELAARPAAFAEPATEPAAEPVTEPAAVPAAAVDAVPAPTVGAPATEAVVTEVHVAETVVGAPASTDVPDERQPVTAIHDSTIRVDVSILDELMNLVGELVLARNQILQYTISQNDPGFVTTSQQLNLITTELQESVMKTRMQPIGTVWNKLPRVVRDLALACGKNVRIETEGEDTELDKTIIEAIKDPLTHIVRNSIDHGIERPDERMRIGKPAEGVIAMRAFHEGGQVIIEIADDGAGLDHARIARKAVERGLVTPDAASRLSERDIAALLFLPGFSTAEQVTNISGRGVGMDVVKSSIERIGGTIDVQSTRGGGTTLRVKIPLTLAIIPALIVTCAESRYAIPQVNLVELLHVDMDTGTSKIEWIGDAPVYRLRGRLLPLLTLRDVFGMPWVDLRRGAHNVVVLQADDQHFGLVVDDIEDTAEIVVKPLGPHLKCISAFAGTTIMGDGTVALILDAIGVAQHRGVLAEHRRTQAHTEPEVSDDRRSPMQTLLVGHAAGHRVAIPIALISRLEEVLPEDVEHSAGGPVVQYRGGLLELVSLPRFFDPTAPLVDGSGRPLQVLVHARGDRVFGLVIDEIIDIIDCEVGARRPSDRPGLDCPVVIGRRVTDLVNLDEVLGIAAGRAHAIAELVS